MLGYSTQLSEDMEIEVYKNGGNCFQFFTRAPQTYTVEKFNIPFWNKIRDKKTTNVIHGSFLINFCKPEDELVSPYVILKEDLKIAHYIKSIGVIIHMGKNTMKTTYEICMDNYIKNIKNILKLTESTPSTLILETGAGQGTEVATNLTDLGKLRKSLTPTEAERVKFCIDTCHIFTAGYDLRKESFVDSFEHYIEMSLGWSNVVVIHLNDCESKFNAHVDRHADIYHGEMTKTWRDTLGFIKFIKMCTKRKIPLILETNQKYSSFADQIALVKGWSST